MNGTNVLFKRSSFFVDVMNVVLYSDLFIYHEITERLKVDGLISYYFSNIPKIDSSTTSKDSWIIHLTAGTPSNCVQV